MTAPKALRLLSLAGIGSFLAASALAQEAAYPYAGLSIGQSRAEIDDERITATLSAAGLTTTSMSRDERDTAYKLYGGWQFNRHVAVEAGYFNLGRFGFTSTTVPTGTLSGRIKLQGVNLDVVGTLPLTGRLSLIGRVGGQYASARDAFSGTGAVNVLDPDPSKRSFGYKAGAGLQYEVSRSFLVRLEAERYRINDAVGNRGDVNLFSLGLVFPFGRAPMAAAPRAMPAPAYVEPAPVVIAAAPPPPVVAVVAAPPPPAPLAPARRRVSFSADSLFTFDEAVVRPEGRAALDRFAQDLKGTQFDVITVEGHTDRLGSDAYNQRLSTRRAEAVKAYLVGTGGLDGARISAVGKSESAPVTKAADCKGSSASAKLLTCLQPDRRVEVEVVGTR